MSNTKKIKALEFPLISEDNINPKVTLDGDTVEHIEWKEFLEILPTFSIPTSTGWINIKESIEKNRSLERLSIDYSDAEFLNIFFKNDYLGLKGLVINFKEGSYLIEQYEFFKLKDGFIQNTLISNYKGREIKFNTNGTNGFSVWKNKLCLEDRMWSIEECEKYIEQSISIRRRG